MSVSITWETRSEATDDAGETTVSSTTHLLEFDAVMRQEHEIAADLTEHTIEIGAAISDHKRIRPRTFRIEGVVTNTPLGALPGSGFASQSITVETQKGQGEAKATVVTFSEEFDRIQDVWDSLKRLASEAIDVTISTRYETYEDLQIVNVRFPEEGPEEAITFTIEAREVFRGSTELVDAPLPREPRGRAASATAAEGEEEETPNDDRNSNLWSLISLAG